MKKRKPTAKRSYKTLEYYAKTPVHHTTFRSYCKRHGYNFNDFDKHKHNEDRFTFTPKR